METAKGHGKLRLDWLPGRETRQKIRIKGRVVRRIRQSPTLPGKCPELDHGQRIPIPHQGSRSFHFCSKLSSKFISSVKMKSAA